MWKFLRGGATIIPGATFIPESRVNKIKLVRPPRAKIPAPVEEKQKVNLKWSVKDALNSDKNCREQEIMSA